MPNVLQVIQQGQLRGAEVFALDLSAALTRDGTWQVAMFSLLGIDRTYAILSAKSGVPLNAGSNNGSAPAHGQIQRLIEAVEREEYQVVQANGGATLKYLVAARRLSRRPWRLVYRAIGMGSYWRRGPYKRVLYRWLFSHADLVIAVSNAVADDLQAAWGVRSDRLTVIPNAVDPRRVRSVPGDRERVRAARGIEPSDCALLYMGSLTDEKNPLEFIEVVSRCRNQGLPVKGTLIGDGLLRGALIDTIQRGGLQHVIQLLPPQDTIGPFLAAADVFIMPSLTEGMPGALLEAGMVGLPVVAYGVGGIPEVIEHGVNGIVIPPGDCAGLVRAVGALVQDAPTRVTMGEAARARAVAYEIGPVASAYRAAYEGLLQRAYA